VNAHQVLAILVWHVSVVTRNKDGTFSVSLRRVPAETWNFVEGCRNLASGGAAQKVEAGQTSPNNRMEAALQWLKNWMLIHGCTGETQLSVINELKKRLNAGK
jgi:hypothetical protein